MEASKWEPSLVVREEERRSFHTSLHQAVEYGKKALDLESRIPEGLVHFEIDCRILDDAIVSYSEVIKLLDAAIQSDKQCFLFTKFRSKLEELLVRYTCHLEKLTLSTFNLLTYITERHNFTALQLHHQLESVIRDIEHPLVRTSGRAGLYDHSRCFDLDITVSETASTDSSTRDQNPRFDLTASLKYNTALSKEISANPGRYLNTPMTENLEISSQRTSFDSFRTATSEGMSYMTAPSLVSLRRSGSLSNGIKNSFHALLQRGIPPRLLQTTRAIQIPRAQIPEAEMKNEGEADLVSGGIINTMGRIRELDFYQRRDSSPETSKQQHNLHHQVNALSSATIAKGCLMQGLSVDGGDIFKDECTEFPHYDQEDEHPFNELDWCGRGMHVDFGDKEEIPLRHLAHAGQSCSAVVDIVRCRRIKLARKMVRLPRRKITPELLQEVLALYRLSHSHVVRLVGTYTYKTTFSTLLYPAAEINLEEYLEELQSDSYFLHDVVCSEGMIPQKFRRFVWDNERHPGSQSRLNLTDGSICLASGLRYLHNSGIIHSDIKPANIILKDVGFYTKPNEACKRFHTYFCDFGISKVLDPEGETQTEEERGKTPRYASPEVIQGIAHGRASDVYSFGCVLAEMVCVYSSLYIKDFRMHIQASSPGPSISAAHEPDLVERRADAPFCYYQHCRPLQIDEWFLQCKDMKVPNNVVSQMLKEDLKKRPRLTKASTDPDALIFEMGCEHDRDGAPPFEIDNEIKPKQAD